MKRLLVRRTDRLGHKIRSNTFKTRKKLVLSANQSWAVRHAPLAQIIGAYSTLAAVIIAGIGYWYTVIPLYQKAAVDEQLAKREAELKKMDIDLENARRVTYELIRGSLLEQAAIRSSFACVFMNHGEESALERVSHSMTPCLTSMSGSIVSTNRLNKEDSQRLITATEEFTKKLEHHRLSTIEEINSVPVAAASNPEILAPDGKNIARVEEFFRKSEPFLNKEQRLKNQEKLYESRVHLTQYKIASEFQVQASDSIVKFYRSGIWPSQKFVK